MISLFASLVLASPCPPPPRLVATFTSGELAIDGELDEPQWTQTPSSGAFPGLDGKPLAPHTELRALWTKDALVLGVYSADQDLRSNDVVHLRVGELAFEVNGAGRLGQKLDGLQVAIERDGTLDDDAGGEDDEEWLIEAVIPWRLLGLKAAPRELPLAIWRDDTPKAAKRRTVSWHHDCSAKPAAGILELRPPAAASP